MRFAIFGNIYQSRKSANIQKILACLDEHDAEVCIERRFYDYLVSTGRIAEGSVGLFDDSLFEADFVISMGGDGTLLRAAGHVCSKGVNMGRLGFLADVLPSEIEEAIASLYDGNYDIENHTVIQAEADGRPLQGPSYALNDIAVLKRDNASMITIHAEVDGEYLVTYQADGLIVSTPTGSTAYSLSNGGPIIVPCTGTLCLTPVAPHSLNIRPIVIPDGTVINLTVESRSHNFLIVKRSGHRYFSTLREKMMWGADSRG